MRLFFRLLALILIFSAVAFLLVFARIGASAPPGAIGLSLGKKTFYIPGEAVDVLRNGWAALGDLSGTLPACVGDGVRAVCETVGDVGQTLSACFAEEKSA